MNVFQNEHLAFNECCDIFWNEIIENQVERRVSIRVQIAASFNIELLV